MKRFNPLIIVALLITTGAVAQAQDESPAPPSPADEMKQEGGMRRGGNDGGAMFLHLINSPRMAEKLALTDDQKKALQVVADDFKAQRKTLQEQMQGTMTDQAELITSDTVDEAAIYSAIDKSFELRRDLAKLQIKTLLAAKKILTPDQIKTLHSMREEFKKKHASARDEWKKNHPDQPTQPAQTNDLPTTPKE